MPFWFLKPKTCLVCAEKEKRISDLKEQMHKQFSITEKVIAPTHQYAIRDQASLALEGAGHSVEPIIEIPEETKKHLSAVNSQALQMLTGRY